MPFEKPAWLPFAKDRHPPAPHPGRDRAYEFILCRICPASMEKTISGDVALKIYAEFDNYHVSPGTAVTLIIRGFLEPAWHIYSIHRNSEEGPQPTTVTYPRLQHEIIGPLQENPPEILDDQVLNLQLPVHKEEFVFQQQFKISVQAEAGSFVFEGVLHFQMCDNHICSPRQHRLFSTPLTIEK